MVRWVRGLLGGDDSGGDGVGPLAFGSAAELGVDPSRLYACCEELVTQGATPGLCVAVARHGKLLQPRAFGTAGPDAGEVNQGLEGGVPLQPDSIFLVASVTKPVVATAVMQLVEQHRVELDAPVCALLPEFRTSSPDDPLASARGDVTVRHLLTHTSGLPDAVPENHALRTRQAPLSEFSKVMIHAPLLFRPGTNISYSSVALNVLGDIVECVAGTTLGEYVKTHIFEPLGMRDTTLGIAADRQKNREVCLNLAPGGYTGTDSGRAFQHKPASEGGVPSSNWNSDYWRELGAPWGGMTSSVGDLAVFCQSILGHEAIPSLLSTSTVDTMTSPQTHGEAPAIDSLPEHAREVEIYNGKPPSCWGLGWRVNHPGTELKFGLNAGRTFGHHGAVGAMIWCDPDTGVSLCVASPEPDMCYSSEFNKLSDQLMAGVSRRNTR